MMNEHDLEFFRELLKGRRQELLEQAEETVDEMITIEKENMPDPTDRASLESNRNFELRIRDRGRKLVSKITEALERIEDKTYGMCKECEESIGVERLKARPVTTLCIDCKNIQEAGEKQSQI